MQLQWELIELIEQYTSHLTPYHMVGSILVHASHMPNLIERCAVRHVVVAQVVDDGRATEHELQRVFEGKQGTRLDTCIESLPQQQQRHYVQQFFATVIVAS